MTWVKHSFKRLVFFFSYLLAKALSKTYRYEYVDLHREDEAKKMSQNQNFVIALWHQNLFSSLCSYSNRKTSFVIIVSASKDGDFISYPIEKFGHLTARGSSSRKGIQALKSALKIMSQGYPAAVTIDGPRGPYHSVKPGVFQLSKLSRSPVLPYVCRAESFWEFSESWDKFRLPKPFTKIICSYGQPFYGQNNADSEQNFNETEYLARELEACEHRALAYMRHRTSKNFDE